MSKETELLKKLDERFVLGEITTEVYNELRSRLLSDASAAPVEAQPSPRDAATAGGMNVCDSVVKGNLTNMSGAASVGSINVHVAAHDHLAGAEIKYERFILTVLLAGGSLARARADLDQRRQEFGLSLRQAREIERACVDAHPATPPAPRADAPPIPLPACLPSRKSCAGMCVNTCVSAFRKRKLLFIGMGAVAALLLVIVAALLFGPVSGTHSSEPGGNSGTPSSALPVVINAPPARPSVPAPVVAVSQPPAAALPGAPNPVATIARPPAAGLPVAAPSIVRSVEGKDLFSQAVTELQKEQDVGKIIRRAFDGFPGNVLKADPVGQPRVISKSASRATIGVKVRFAVDVDKYAKWQNAFIPLLTKLASKSEEVRFDPKSFGRSLIRLSELGGPDNNGFIGVVPGEEMGVSYYSQNRLESLPRWLPAAAGEAATLTVIRRQGSSKAVVLYIDEAAAADVARAAAAIPIVDLVLKNGQGDELDGQSHVIGFNAGPIAYSETLFFDKQFGARTLLKFYDEEAIKSDWKPNEYFLRDWAKGCIIAPYTYAEGYGVFCLISAFDVEFRFDLPLDALAKLKTVEARVSSRNNAEP